MYLDYGISEYGCKLFAVKSPLFYCVRSIQHPKLITIALRKSIFLQSNFEVPKDTQSVILLLSSHLLFSISVFTLSILVTNGLVKE